MTSTQKLLFTPGPINTSISVKESMLIDFGSREPEFERATSEIIDTLHHKIYDGLTDMQPILLQGPSTYSLEACFKTLVKGDEKVLVISNGTYGDRLFDILRSCSINCELQSFSFLAPICSEVLDKLSISTNEYAYVACVHCETSTGILNNLNDIDQFARSRKLKLLVDCVSSFGGIEIDFRALNIAAFVGSINKCLRGAPGFSFCFMQKQLLIESKGNCKSLSFDLEAQWRYMQKTGQWRFTAPTHIVVAARTALHEYLESGGVAAEVVKIAQRYDILISGATAAGFSKLVPSEYDSKIIVAFSCEPEIFKKIYSRCLSQNIVLYPGCLGDIPYFRIGCIGKLSPDHYLKLFGVLNDDESI